uniref:Ig-like domain-containing protein n=1 Tax=Buteo japonicus TaxID=224669 RepID=A0A8C0BBM0_9AVES
MRENLLVWTWILLPGCWALKGPAEMTAEQGGSLTVSCSYKLGYKLYSKHWCRRACLSFCFTYIAQTNSSEVTVTQGRVSIRDNYSACSFTMTLGSVKPEDAGWYFCRVMKSREFSLRRITEVMVSTGKARLGAKQGWEGLGHRQPVPAELELPTEDNFAIKPGHLASACLSVCLCVCLLPPWAASTAWGAGGC